MRIGIAVAAMALPGTAAWVQTEPPRADDYFRLRDDMRKDPGMPGHLAAENAHADATLAPLKPLRARLYGETVSHIRQDDSTRRYRAQNRSAPFYRKAFGDDVPMPEQFPGRAR